jgi:hypothetical protein
MSKILKLRRSYVLAIASGAMAFFVVASAQAAGNGLVAMCYRGRTINVPRPFVQTYEVQGATLGSCSTSPN